MVPELIPNEKSLEEAKELLEDVNRIRAQVVAPLMEFRKKTKGRKKASDFCASLYDFLCTLEFPRKLKMPLKSLEKAGI